MSRSAAVLAEARRPACAMAEWRRPADPSLLARLAALPHDELDDLADDVSAGTAEVEVFALLEAAGYPAEVMRPLASDVATLIRLQAGVWEWDRVVLRLEWIETDACRRFHCDRVTTRLLTTYVGPGTQWRCADQPYEAAAQLATGDVGIFKGRLLAPDAPILHRSPPIAGTGTRRLLLVIDDPAAALR